MASGGRRRVPPRLSAAETSPGYEPTGFPRYRENPIPAESIKHERPCSGFGPYPIPDVDQNRDDLTRRVGSLTLGAVLGLHLRRVQLAEQISVEETIVIVGQQVEHVGGKQLTLVVILRLGFEGRGHPTLS